MTAVEEESQGWLPRLPLRARPNPVSGNTDISYRLDRAGRVTCSVYDAAGGLVKKLRDEVQGPGEHSVRWDAASAVPGVYFAEVTAGGETRSYRLTAVR